MVSAKKYWERIIEVQRRVNRETRYQPDAVTYDRSDFWVAVGPGRVGDCEDYALAKRAELMAEIPAEALRLATCWTETGIYHAVLVVTTDQGDYVLDNRHDWPEPWANLPYRWHKMQGPDGRWRVIE